MPAGIAWPTVGVASVRSPGAGRTGRSDPDHRSARRPGPSTRGRVRPGIAGGGRASRAKARRPHTWEAYRLTAIEGLSGAEAAARLGMKVAAVFVSRSHVTKQLQSEVRDLEAHPSASLPE